MLSHKESKALDSQKSLNDFLQKRGSIGHAKGSKGAAGALGSILKMKPRVFGSRSPNPILKFTEALGSNHYLPSLHKIGTSPKKVEYSGGHLNESNSHSKLMAISKGDVSESNDDPKNTAMEHHKTKVKNSPLPTRIGSSHSIRGSQSKIEAISFKKSFSEAKELNFNIGERQAAILSKPVSPNKHQANHSSDKQLPSINLQFTTNNHILKITGIHKSPDRNVRKPLKIFPSPCLGKMKEPNSSLEKPDQLQVYSSSPLPQVTNKSADKQDKQSHTAKQPQIGHLSTAQRKASLLQDPIEEEGYYFNRLANYLYSAMSEPNRAVEDHYRDLHCTYRYCAMHPQVTIVHKGKNVDVAKDWFNLKPAEVAKKYVGWLLLDIDETLVSTEKIKRNRGSDVVVKEISVLEGSGLVRVS